MVITNRLSKKVIFEAMADMAAPTVAKVFMEAVMKHHIILRAIVSDRGKQFVGLFWGEIGKALGIQRRLSTAFHPQTDGATERANHVTGVPIQGQDAPDPATAGSGRGVDVTTRRSVAGSHPTRRCT